MSEAIQLRANGPQNYFTPDQEKLIRDSFLNGAPADEAAVLMELAKARRLNPITRQIHFVKRWDGQKKREVWAAQVGIDGFRSIAERTGLYDGQDEAEFEYEGKQLRLCRVRVWRKGWSRPSVGVAHFTEYAQVKKEGGLTQMWATKPHVMLAKCAEALAFRKAFPEDMSGICSPEEMGAEEEKELNAAPTPAVVTKIEKPSTRTEDVRAKVNAALAEKKALTDGAEKAALDEKELGQRLKFLATKADLLWAEMAPHILEHTGKKDWRALTGADLTKLEAELSKRFDLSEPPDDVPPPNDNDAPGLEGA